MIVGVDFKALSGHKGNLTDNSQGCALDNELIKTNLSVLNSFKR